nr:putative serine/threonine-protein kinase pbl8 [Quercus suber]
MAPNPIELPWDEVRQFTNFDMKIGEGGFGDVYKGLYEDDDVAVKIADYNRTTDPKFKQWEAEVHALSQLVHQNIIRLRGYGHSKHEKKLFLIYDFMPTDVKKEISGLQWQQTLNILKDTTSAIVFMHNFEPQFIYADLKPGNILLDEGRKVKIGDFGSAMPYGRNIPATTPGYSAPEITVHASAEADVYSLGILMLQLIMKVEEVTFTSANKREKDLITCAKEKQLIKGHAVHKNLLKDGCTVEKATKITELALLCAQTSPRGRPILYEVLTRLNQIACKY